MEKQHKLRNIDMTLTERELECIRQAIMSLLEELDEAERSRHPFSPMSKEVMGDMFVSGQSVRAKMELKILEFNADEMAFMQIAIQMMIDQGRDMTSNPAFMARFNEKAAQNIRNILSLAQSVQQKFNAATGEEFNMPEITAEDKEWMLVNPE